MLKIRLNMSLEDEILDNTGFHIESLYNRKCVTMFYPNPMQSPKEVVLDILRQTFERMCEDIVATVESESKYDLEFVFDKNTPMVKWEDRKDDRK